MSKKRTVFVMILREGGSKRAWSQSIPILLKISKIGLYDFQQPMVCSQIKLGA
jgi:hypothetical protein